MAVSQSLMAMVAREQPNSPARTSLPCLRNIQSSNPTLWALLSKVSFTSMQMCGRPRLSCGSARPSSNFAFSVDNGGREQGIDTFRKSKIASG